VYIVEVRTPGGWSRLGIYRTRAAADVHADALALCHAHGAPAVRVREMPRQAIQWGWQDQPAEEEVTK